MVCDDRNTHSAQTEGLDEITLAKLRKLELEAKEIEERLNRKWYKGRFFLEVIVGVIVTSALVAAWFITYLDPILSKKQKLATIEAKIQEGINRQQAQKNEEKRKLLVAENKSISTQLASISVQNSALHRQLEEAEKRATSFQDRLQKQEAEFTSLAQRNNLTKSDRDRLAKLATEAQDEVKRLEGEIAGLKVAQNVVQTREKDLQQKITASQRRADIWKSTEYNNYVALDNGIVYDSDTGLEWFVGPDKDTTWGEAKEWVKSLKLDGGGWRMPTGEELKSLYKEGAGDRNMSPLLKTTGWFVWSGETEDSSSAWLFGFDWGIGGWDSRDESGYRRVFAVRSRKR